MTYGSTESTSYLQYSLKIEHSNLPFTPRAIFAYLKGGWEECKEYICMHDLKSKGNGPK